MNLTNNPKREMGKAWLRAFSHLFSVCSLSLPLPVSLCLFLCPFSIIHILVLTHACSEPPDILSANTFNSLSGHYSPPYSSPPPHLSILHPPSPNLPALLREVEINNKTGYMLYLPCNQTFPLKLCIFSISGEPCLNLNLIFVSPLLLC